MPGRNYITDGYDYAVSISRGSSRQLYTELLAPCRDQFGADMSGRSGNVLTQLRRAFPRERRDPCLALRGVSGTIRGLPDSCPAA